MLQRGPRLLSLLRSPPSFLSGSWKSDSLRRSCGMPCGKIVSGCLSMAQHELHTTRCIRTSSSCVYHSRQWFSSLKFRHLPNAPEAMQPGVHGIDDDLILGCHMPVIMRIRNPARVLLIGGQPDKNVAFCLQTPECCSRSLCPVSNWAHVTEYCSVCVERIQLLHVRCQGPECSFGSFALATGWCRGPRRT